MEDNKEFIASIDFENAVDSEDNEIIDEGIIHISTYSSNCSAGGDSVLLADSKRDLIVQLAVQCYTNWNADSQFSTWPIVLDGENLGSLCELITENELGLAYSIVLSSDEIEETNETHFRETIIG